MNLHNTRIWLTGASSGIGHALAQQLIDAGASVAVSARRAERLDKLAGARVLTLAFDVCDASATQQAADRINDAWGGLDWAILNAGDCEYMNPPPWDHAMLRRLMEVNFFGASHCAAAALPLLTQSPSRGLLAAVSSAAAFCPLPRASAYGATKAALSYFIRALEPHYPTVDFCLIHPGFVRTPLTDRNDFAMPWLLPADVAATKILRGLIARRENITFPRRLRWALKIISALPPAGRRVVWQKMMSS